MADDATQDRPKVTIDIDGEAREIELPDGFLPESQVRENFMPKTLAEQEREKAVRTAVKEAKGKLSAELIDSEDFLERILDLKGDEVRERLGVNGSQGPTDADFDKIRKRMIEAEVNPREERIKELSERAERLQKDALRGAWSRAIAEAGVEEDYAELVELWLEKRSAYDDEHGPVVLDDDGNPDFVLEDGGKHRPKTPRDLLSEIRKSGSKPGWFRGETTPGVGYKGAGTKGSPSGRNIQDMSEAEKRAFIRENGQEEYFKLLRASRERKSAA